jgi:hypothetical protein
MIHAGRSLAWERARNFSIIDVLAGSSTRGYRLTDVADDVSPELAIDAARQPAERNGALAVQTRSAEPAGGWAAGPSAVGPPLQPQMHDAASTTQIRLATANLPALP